MKMRKALSFVLVLALVLGSFSMVFAADGVKQGSDLSDISGNANYDAIVANSDLGIITGYEDGSYKPANNVNRAEFAAMITRMMGVPDSALAGYSSTNFTDMTGYGWASSYVGFCAAKGIVNGYGDGTFGPGNTITVNEAVTMVLRSVGYVSNSNMLVGTWPSNYVTLGKRLGIYDDVASTTTIDRANAAQVIYNALTCTVMAVNTDGTTEAAYVDKANNNYEKTVLEVYLDCKLLNTANDGFAVYTYQNAQDSVINTMNYVGAYVKAFKNDDGDVVAIAESKSTFLTGKYTVDDEEFKVGDTVYTLTDDNAEKAQAVFLNMDKIADDVVTGNNLDKDNDTLFNGDTTGSVTLAADVSGKTIKEVYSVSKWEANDAFFYETDMLEDDNLNGYDFTLNDDNEIDNAAFQLNGAKGLSNIAKDNIVEVFTYGVDANKDIVRVDVGTETVTGKVSMVKDGDDYTIGGKVYSIAEPFANDKDDEPEAGDTGIAYLNFKGEFAGWEEQDASSDNYAIVSGKFIDATVPASTVRNSTIMLVDKTGAEKEYIVKNDNDAFDVADQLTTDTPNATGSVTITKPSELAIGDLVTFSLDKNGKIDELIPVADFTLPEVDNPTTDNKVNKNRTLYGNSKLDNGVVVFTYDGALTYVDGFPTFGDFDVMNLSDLEADEELVGTYSYMDDEGKVKVLLVNGDYTGADSIYAVINSATKSVNDDDDTILCIEGIADGKEFTWYTDDDSYGVIADGYSADGDAANRNAVYEITRDANGIITEIEALDETTSGPNNNIGDREDTVRDTVADVTDGGYSIKVDGAYRELDPESVQVYTYDIAEGEFIVSDVKDIYDGSKVNKPASTVAVWQADDDSEVYDIVVIYDNLTKVTYGVSAITLTNGSDDGSLKVTFGKAVTGFDETAVTITDGDGNVLVVGSVVAIDTKNYTVNFTLDTAVNTGDEVTLTISIDSFDDYNVTTSDVTKATTV